MFLGIRLWAAIRAATIQQLGRAAEKVLKLSILRGHHRGTNYALNFQNLPPVSIDVWSERRHLDPCLTLFIGANHSPESALHRENRNVVQNQTVRAEFGTQSVSRVMELRRSSSLVTADSLPLLYLISLLGDQAVFSLPRRNSKRSILVTTPMRSSSLISVRNTRP